MISDQFKVEMAVSAQLVFWAMLTLQQFCIAQAIGSKGGY
jgi:hypothetical protein